MPYKEWYEKYVPASKDYVDHYIAKFNNSLTKLEKKMATEIDKLKTDVAKLGPAIDLVATELENLKSNPDVPDEVLTGLDSALAKLSDLAPKVVEDVENVPTDETPVDPAPADETPVDPAPVDEVPTEDVPANEDTPS